MHTIHAGHPTFARDARAAWSRLSAVLELPEGEDSDECRGTPPVRHAAPRNIAPLQPGHYLALQTIYLPAGFPSIVLPTAASFDVLAIAGDMARIHFAEVRDWVHRSVLEGRAVCTAKKIVGDDGFTMLPVSGVGV